MMAIDYITPESYQSKRRHRRLANKVMTAAGVAPNDVTLLARRGDRWAITVLLRDADGHAFTFVDPRPVVCDRTVVFPPWSWQTANQSH